MADRPSTPSRRGILAFLAAAPMVTLPMVPAMPAIPSFGSMFAGKSWKGCVAKYRESEQAVSDAQAHFDAINASCKAAYGKLVVPPSFRVPWLRVMGWLDMSVDEIREDFAARRPMAEGPRKQAIVEKDMEGVAEFKAAQAQVWKPRDEARELLYAANDRLSEAEDELRNFEVTSVLDLAEKMSIARELESEWIMEAVESDLERLASAG